jgi:hypothetical protein
MLTLAMLEMPDRGVALEHWSDFFVGELGAAATLAGLLFVSVSVNQSRILELGRMADRGMEALLILLLTLIVASLGLVPEQSPRLLGGEIVVISILMLAVTVALQRGYLRQTEMAHRRSTRVMIAVSRFAVALIALAGLLLVWRGDTNGLYLLAPGILLCFFAAGANAWVLLIEIRR